VKYVAKTLGPLVGKTGLFIKDSFDFITIIKNERVELDDIIIIFDVVSLFTKIPLGEAISIIKEVTDPKTAKVA
jgi:hypothetical protein